LGRALTKAYDQNYDIDKVSDNSTTGLSQDGTVNIMGNITAMIERISHARYCKPITKSVSFQQFQ